MLDILKNAWKVVDIRKKIFYTLMILLVFRIGSVIPVPFVDVAAIGEGISHSGAAGTFFDYISALTGAGLDYAAIFAMSVTPYINASIILQLLSVAIPALERIAKEGEEGRKKIAKLTRYATVILGLLQGTAYYFYLKNTGIVLYDEGFAGVFAGIVIVLCFTAGSAVMMWMGERIDEKGIGNGISMLLFAGIIARVPDGVASLWYTATQTDGGIIKVVLILLLFLAIIGFIVFMTAAERRIPVQYAKRVVGRKMYGGQNSHIPIQVNMSGVMPIIFASSFLSIPTMVCGFMTNTDSFIYKLCAVFSTQGVFYAVLYFAMIIGFAYFYVTIQYNPIEMANNLRKNSGAVPGIRPGKPTVDYLKRIMSRITLIGALFLGVLAVLPVILGSVTGMGITLGGTSVLIVVGVALDTVKNLESQLMMRHYKGFLD